MNSYAVFAEWNWALLNPMGMAGYLVPSGIATDYTTREFFQEIIERRSLCVLYSFAEIREFFPGSESRGPFAIVTLGGRSRIFAEPDLAFDLWQTAELADPGRRFSLTAEDFALLNPNTRTCPTFRGRRDANIARRAYRRHTVLVREVEPSADPWRVRMTQGLFNMASDSGIFRDRSEMEKDGWQLAGNGFVKGGARCLPLYEAKMIHHFDHRLGTYDGQTQAQSNQGILPRLSLEQHADPNYLALPWFWVPEADVDAAVGDWKHDWFFGWRDICRSTDERTVISAFIPRVGVGDKFLLCLPDQPPSCAACLGALMGSLMFDYFARQKVGGTSLKYFTMRQLPVIPPATFQFPIPWLIADTPAVAWFASRVLELTYTAHDMAPFARDLGYDGPPFRWDDARRTQIRAELDAAFLHLYGLDRSDAEWVLDSFPVLKKNEESKLGEFRTKSLVLAMYDAMAEAQRTSTAFVTPLSPPPADPRATHAAAAIAPAAAARPGATAPIAPPPAIAAPPAPVATPPATATPPTPTGEPPLAPIIPLPFRKVDRPKPKDKYRTCIPAESIKAAAGAFSDVQERAPTDWAEVTTSTPLAKGMFIAQVEGHSMEPDIPHGAWCIFQRPWLTPRSGEIGIFQLHESTDPDTGAHVTVKKYTPAITRSPEGDPQWAGTLTPSNPAFTPIPITEGVRPYAKLIEMLHWPP